MSQYVPPHLRNRSSSSSVPSVSGPPLPSRGSSSTMASLTRSNTSSVSSRSAPPAGSDFPALALPPKDRNSSSPWSNGTKSFADLARTWAVEQKEKEEKEKIQAKERMTQAQLEKEKEEKERAFYRIDVVDSTRLIYGMSQNKNDRQPKSRYEEDEEDTRVNGEDDLSYEDDEEEARELNDDWNYRRNRNELY